MVKETIRVYARVKPLGRRQQAGVGWGARCYASAGWNGAAEARHRAARGPEGGRERAVAVNPVQWPRPPARPACEG